MQQGSTVKKLQIVTGMLLLGWTVLPQLAMAQVNDLGSPEPGARVQAIFAIRSTGDRSALPKLAEMAVSDPHKGVRLFSTMALGELGGVEQLPVLERVAAQDAAPEVRQAAERSMEQITARGGVVQPGLPPSATPTALPVPAETPPPAAAYPASPLLPAPLDPSLPDPATAPGMPPAYAPPGAPAFPPPGAAPYAPPAYFSPAVPTETVPVTSVPVPAAVPLVMPPGPAPGYAEQGNIELSGTAAFTYSSLDEIVTKEGTDLTRTTSHTLIGFDVTAGYFVLDRLALRAQLGLELHKNNISNDELNRDIGKTPANEVTTVETSEAINELALRIGAAYVAPLSDTLFLDIGALGGAKLRMAQLDRALGCNPSGGSTQSQCVAVDENGIGFQIKGLLALRYELHPHVQLLTQLQVSWGSRRLTVTPVTDSAAYDRDQSGLDVGLGVGLATWF